MPRKKKHPKDMTSDELARHVFGPKVAAHLKKVAHEGEAVKPVRKPKSDSQPHSKP